MPSRALTRWRSEQAIELNQIQAAHSALEGTGRGRRYRTKQLNGAYVILLSAHFQKFCRNLHSEAALVVARTSGQPAVRDAILAGLTQDRELDRANPRPSNLTKDFRRFKMELWIDVGQLDTRTQQRRVRLEQLNTWRNAVGHQDFAFSPEQLHQVRNTALTLQSIRIWRRACDGLAGQFDRAVEIHLTNIVGTNPW